jgi:hypothetical protein
MSRFMGAGRALLGAAVLVGAFVASGNARADDDHHGGGYGGASLSLTQGTTNLGSGTVSSVQVAARHVAGAWQYRVDIVAAPDRHQPKTLTCSVALGSLTEAQLLRDQVTDSHAMSVACTVAAQASVTANDTNNATVVLSGSDGDVLTVQTRS